MFLPVSVTLFAIAAFLCAIPYLFGLKQLGRLVKLDTPKSLMQLRFRRIRHSQTIDQHNPIGDFIYFESLNYIYTFYACFALVLAFFLKTTYVDICVSCILFPFCTIFTINLLGCFFYSGKFVQTWTARYE